MLNQPVHILCTVGSAKQISNIFISICKPKFSRRRIVTLKMSLKRITVSAVNLADLAQFVRPEQMQHFTKFRQNVQRYINALNMHPPDAPPIDWEYYKRKVKPERVPMIEDFQQSYKALRIPYPLDNLSVLIEQQREAVEAEIREFIKESNARICNYQEQVARLQKMIPFEQMTIEDFIEAFPDDGPDCHNRPTLWPHTIAEQLNMVALPKPILSERPTEATVVPNCISCENPSRNDEFLWKLG